MVRSIRSCSECGLRYVSNGGKKSGGKYSQCSCENGILAEERQSPTLDKENSSNATKIYSGLKSCRESLLLPTATEEPSQSVEVYSDSDNDDNDDVSEGGDDFYCTQIVESSQDSEDDETKEQQIRTETNSQATVPKETRMETIPPVATNFGGAKQKQLSNSGGSTNPDNICFICGTDLSKLKRRIDHIKRCSKKYGITGKDVRAVEETEAITTDSTEELSDRTTPEDEDSWHGDAEQLLKLTNPTSTKNSITQNASSWEKLGYDAKTGTFVTAATVAAPRNLNSILMAGSRRMEVLAKVTDKRSEIEKAGSKKRPRFFGSKRETWSCPMYKKITGTDFVVDGFRYASKTLTKNYFLTHFHSDHYGGIASSWDFGTIYCSLATASLVAQQLRVDKKYLHPLPMNTPTVIESRGKAITVTLLDANHCPGAIMFLFEVGKRKILHVGDFRWSRDVMLQDPLSPLGKVASQEATLDELYLDTTYCNERYQLPSQSITIQAIIETFEQELVRCRESSPPKRTLHLFGAYTIGKEKMFLSVAKHFNLKVYVDKARHRILSAVELPEECMKLLTTNKEIADIWVVPMGHLNMKKLPEYYGIANSKPFAQGYDRIVGYRPTGWSLSRSGIINTRNSGNLSIHSAPYSEHSSFPELVDCLACLRPAKIIPTVKATKSDEQVKLLMQGLRNKQTGMKLFFKSTAENQN